ncbi:MAG: hypothetical protein J0J01_20330 [Reyranella sp.]|uniref:hypothetical protein n=1 Tax=Reyranella sp. TaxID=1929291 RepID=UPI001AC25946|nr:hypothetical protein [Reyranella sp.]MBN9089262.1 hypothetical protein [Reyranella sp.]
MRRRALLLSLPLTGPIVASAQAPSGLWPEWLGSYAGALRFYRSIPLEDIVPPPKEPHVDADDSAPFAVHFSIRVEDGGAAVWLRIDGGPMQTSTAGETLRFGPVLAGVAQLTAAQARPEPRAATMTVRPDSLGTEALFAFADGSFWRRHFNARFTPSGADLIVWVFDAHGTRARTWRGSALRFPPTPPQDGRAPT